MLAILTTLVGGLLAITGGLVGIALGDRRERTRWLRDSQWQASSSLLSALQLAVRRMINVAYLSVEASVDQADPAVTAYNEAAGEWNRALYNALLIAPPEVADRIPLLDRELDRLLDLTIERHGSPSGFQH